MPDKPFYSVSTEEFYQDFRQVANLTGDRPIVRQVQQNTKDIQALRFRYYAILGGVGTGVVTVLAILARSIGL